MNVPFLLKFYDLELQFFQLCGSHAVWSFCDWCSAWD
jgi:hypothetical protein